MTVLRMLTRLNSKITNESLTRIRNSQIKIIYQRSLIYREFASKIRAAREDKNDSSSPFIRVDDPIPFDKTLLKGPTIAHWFDSVIDKHGDSKSIGKRTILSECEEKQPNGKMQKKYILDDDYSFKSYKQVRDKVKQIISGLISNGVGPGDKVILFSETREEWLLSAFAIWKLGAIVVTMYANLGLEGITYILEQTKAAHMVASPDCLDKLSKISDKINHLKVIFCASCPTSKSVIKPSSLNKLEVIPFDETYHMNDDSNFVYPKPEDIAVIMYTSGSTGIPKGVLISHSNFMASVRSIIISFLGDYQCSNHEAYLAYLPLAHIFEMGVEVLMFTIGIPICYSSPLTMLDSSIAIKEGFKGDINIAKPTVMAAVPLVLDRIKKSIEEKVSTSVVKRNLFPFVLSYKKILYRYGIDSSIFDKLVFRKVRDTLGGRLKLMFVGGAPLSIETQQFILSTLGITLIQGYAATEITSCGCFMCMDERTFGRCGPPSHGTKFALSNWPEGGYYNTDKPNPRGELVIGGPVVTMGYYMNEEETDKVYWVDKDGTRWWRSGDIGEVFEDGTIKIIDRKKDLIKLQHGEYISLGKVESVLKNCPYIDNICVYGDSFHNYLIAFVLPERNSLNKLAESLGKGEMNHESLCSDKEMITKVLETIRDFGESKGLLKMELPNRIKLCTEEWTPDNGLVTAALKIRRLQIQQFYKQSIDSLYSRS